MAYAFVVPIPPGKTEAVRRLTEESLTSRRRDFDDMQRRSGVTHESYWLQEDPDQGDTLIVFSSSDQTDFTEIMANPKTDFDRWYKAQVMDIVGADPGEPWGGRNELIGTWGEGAGDESMTYAFSAPIPPGKTDAARRFTAEVLGPRRADYDDLQHRSNIAHEAYWLQHDDDGDTMIVVSDSDQLDGIAALAHPQSDFDRWFRDQVREIFEFDPTVPSGPRNELLGAWKA